MRLFNGISDWRAARKEKWISKMESQGKCPDCRGYGIEPLPMTDMGFTQIFDCPSCNGSGLYSDWAEAMQQEIE